MGSYHFLYFNYHFFEKFHDSKDGIYACTLSMSTYLRSFTTTSVFTMGCRGDDDSVTAGRGKPLHR